MKTFTRAALALGVFAGVAVAQNPPAQQGQTVQPRRGQAGQQREPGQMRGGMDRADMEQRIRERIGTALKKNLNLNDDQFAKLQATNKRFEERRKLLVEQERDARMGMRDLMIAGDTTNQAKVSQGLDRMLQVQRQRFELVEQEQKELAGYLTPMQRAKYLGMQEQMFRRMQELRDQRMGPGGPPDGPPMDGPMGPPGMRDGKPGMGGGIRGFMRPGQKRPPNGPPPGGMPPDGEIIP